jgi:hypothetical protein
LAFYTEGQEPSRILMMWRRNTGRESRFWHHFCEALAPGQNKRNQLVKKTFFKSSDLVIFADLTGKQLSDQVNLADLTGKKLAIR